VKLLHSLECQTNGNDIARRRIVGYPNRKNVRSADILPFCFTNSGYIPHRWEEALDGKASRIDELWMINTGVQSTISFREYLSKFMVTSLPDFDGLYRIDWRGPKPGPHSMMQNNIICACSLPRHQIRDTHRATRSLCLRNLDELILPNFGITSVMTPGVSGLYFCRWEVLPVGCSCICLDRKHGFT
jgi:hypothetical protein